MQPGTPATETFADDEIDLRDLVGIILSGWPLLLAVGSIVVALGVLYAWKAPRIYTTDALIQVEQDQSSLPKALGDVESLLSGAGEQAEMTAEIELLRSRMVVGEVVDDLQLTITAKPNYFPLLGAAVARGFAASDEQPVAPAVGGLRQFAWGGESIRVTTLELPAGLLGKDLTLTALEGGEYQLDYDGQVLLAGRVGARAQVELAPGEAVTIFVQELLAASGTQFTVSRAPRLLVVGALQGALNVVEKGKDSGILSVTYENEDRVLAREIVNRLVNVYQRQNVERRSAEAQQTLEFVQKQLPELRKQVNAAEDALNEYRLRRGSADLSQETQLVLQQSVELETNRVTLEQKREEALQRFTPEHPSVQAIDRQLAQMRAEQNQVGERVKALPETQQELLRLTRDVEVANTLYTALLNSAQELQVVKAGTVGNVRIVDHAELPISPSKPKTTLIYALSLVLGGFLGMVAVFVRRALHSGVDDPMLVENALGLATYCAVPYAQAQMRIRSLMKRDEEGERLLAVREPTGTATEALRSLRTSLHFGQLEAKNNILMLTGPSPGLGKSFVSANLGAVLAISGKKIALVDADLRRGHLHDYFNAQRAPGLSDFIAGTAAIADVLRPSQVENLHYVATGAIPPNPAELLLSDRLEELFDYLSKHYDTVIVDTPPVLAVTDAAIVGRFAGTTLLVLKAGEHPLRMIEDAVKRLRTAGVPVRGTIFNQVGLHGQGRYGYKYGYNYGYYHYDYASKSKS